MLTQSEALDVLAALGVEVDHVAGEEIWALCPMHERRTGKPDNHPSWSLNHDKSSHNCFSCGYTGHLVELVADLRDVDLGRARRWLHKAGASLEMAQNLPTWAEREHRTFAPGGAKPLRVREDALSGFTEPPEASMERRKVTREAVAHYGVWWDPRGRGWVLPVRLPDGELLGYQFKRKSLVRNRPPAMSKSATLFGIDVFTGGKAILVESPLDCLYLYSLGITGAVSSFGAHVSDTQMRMLIEHADDILLALDNDGAGRAETKRLITGITWVRKKPVQGMVWPRRIPMYVFNYGEDADGKDPGELERPEVYRGLRESEHDLEWMARHGGPHQSPSVPVSRVRSR